MAAEDADVEGRSGSKPPFSRRLRRGLVDAITVLSLLLAIAAAWGWWRSHQGIYRKAMLERMTGDVTEFSELMLQVHCYNGSLGLQVRWGHYTDSSRMYDDPQHLRERLERGPWDY